MRVTAGYLLFFALYLVPTWCALLRRHRQWEGIALLNVAFGWTIVGWLAAMIWAATERKGRPWPVTRWWRERDRPS
jgi:hypothetical protein